MSFLIEDCLRIIFNELRNDPTSLYSCILVNRFWCQIGVQILWKNPSDFDLSLHSRSKLYNTIIYLLPRSSKQFLIDNNINLPSTSYSNQPSFNYISYFSQISNNFIYYIIASIIKDKVGSDKFEENYKKLEQEIYKLFVNNCKNIKDFRWATTQPLTQYPGASICFSQLHCLSISIKHVTSTTLLEMAQIFQNIEELKIWDCNGDIPSLIKLIDIQKKLKLLDLRFNGVENQCKELSNVIERKTATLKMLTIVSGFTVLSPKFLPSLNLEYLRLKDEFSINRGSVEEGEWENYLSISSFPNIQRLKTSLLPFYDYYTLIEKSHGNILEISIFHSYLNLDLMKISTKKLFKAIAKNCPKIEKLKVQATTENLDDIIEIFLNCSKLRGLFLSSLYNYYDYVGENCDELLEILINFSPKTFCEFSFDKYWNFSVNGLQNFFENWRGRTPIKFNTRFDRNHLFTEEHRIIVKKYFDEGVIDKKTKYLKGINA